MLTPSGFCPICSWSHFVSGAATWASSFGASELEPRPRVLTVMHQEVIIRQGGSQTCTSKFGMCCKSCYMGVLILDLEHQDKYKPEYRKVPSLPCSKGSSEPSLHI